MPITEITIMRIGLLDCHNVDYTAVADLTRPRKTKYCKKHGYDLLYHIFERDIGRFPTWGKVLGMKKYLPQYDYICFLDTDIFIMDPEVKVEDQINGKHNIFIGFMPHFHNGVKTHLSTSAWIMRNNDWSLAFLDKWWDTTKYLTTHYPKNNRRTPATRGYGGIYHEQSAFSYLYDIDKDCRVNTKVMPFPWFNHREVNYERGAFLVHFARQEKKLERMKGFLQQHILLV